MFKCIAACAVATAVIASVPATAQAPSKIRSDAIADGAGVPDGEGWTARASSGAGAFALEVYAICVNAP